MDTKTNIYPHVPTTTARMREAIIMALAQLHAMYPEDGGYLTSDVQSRITYLAGGDQASDWVFDMREAPAKAYERAMAQLEGEGVVERNPDDPNGIERRLVALVAVAEEHA